MNKLNSFIESIKKNSIEEFKEKFKEDVMHNFSNEIFNELLPDFLEITSIEISGKR